MTTPKGVVILPQNGERIPTRETVISTGSGNRITLNEIVISTKSRERIPINETVISTGAKRSGETPALVLAFASTQPRTAAK